MLNLEQEASERSLVNLYRAEGGNYFELARAFAKHLECFGGSARRLAHTIGIGPSSIHHYLSVLALPPQVQEELTRHRLGFKVARAIADIPWKDVRRQLEIAELFREGGTSCIEEVVARAKKEPSRPAGDILQQIMRERGSIRFAKPVGPRRRSGVRFRRLEASMLELAGMLGGAKDQHIPFHERIRLMQAAEILSRNTQAFLETSRAVSAKRSENAA